MDQSDKQTAEIGQSVVSRIAEVASYPTNKTSAEESGTEDEGVSTPHQKRKYSKRTKEPLHRYPVQPTVVRSFAKPINVVNHSYRDFSRVPPEQDWQIEHDISKMTFSEKVHHMLSDESNSVSMSWRPHGRAFFVHRPTELEKQTLPTYFGHGRYSSFLTRLKRHGFKQLTVGDDRGCYYHECMLCGMPHLCKYMPLIPVRRKMIPDPDNEPDFYAIGRTFPLDAITMQASSIQVASTSLPVQSPNAASVLGRSQLPR